MKTKLLLFALTIAAALSPLSARAQDEVSFEFFYDNLSPYGDWMEVGDYGNCWRPRDVDEDWSPYTDGYWSYTDAGWTWISYEDFGDICYHYGRWVKTADVGWIWVPDYEWGPAWVSWRKSDDYIGWAPLPPEAEWRPSVGFSVWVDDTYDIGPAYYNFCPVVDFGAPIIRPVCLPRVRVFSIFGGTVNITNISYNSYGHGHRVFCGGPDFYRINRFARRPIPALKLVQNNTIINNTTIINNRTVVRAPRNRIAGNTLQVFAPKVVNKAAANIQPKITKVIEKPKIEKGWAAITDPGQRTKLREKVKSEAKGLTPQTAPAKPVQVADLKPVPEKADPTAPSPVQVGKGGKGKGARAGERIAETPGATPGEGRPGKEKPGKPGKPVPPIATTPTEPPAATTDKPNQPTTLPAESAPGKVAAEKPERPEKVGKGAKAGKAARSQALAPDRRPATPASPLTKPFREQPAVTQSPATPQVPEAPDKAPAQPKGKGRKGGDADRTAAAEQQLRIQRAQQQKQLEAEGVQRRQAEQSAKQRHSATMERQQGAADEARRAAARQRVQQQFQSQQDAAARQQRAAEAAQRQSAMQRQAEVQQRQFQAQRQQQLQRQMQIQRSQQQQQFVPRQQPAPRQQPRPQAQPRPQVQPQRQAPQPAARGGGRGQQISPEQLEALKKRGR